MKDMIYNVCICNVRGDRSFNFSTEWSNIFVHFVWIFQLLELALLYICWLLLLLLLQDVSYQRRSNFPFSSNRFSIFSRCYYLLQKLQDEWIFPEFSLLILLSFHTKILPMAVLLEKSQVWFSFITYKEKKIHGLQDTMEIPFYLK